MSINPFRIAIPQATLDDLKARLLRTRWPDEIEGADWDYGTNLGYLKSLTHYWLHTFDWRTQEAKLNQFAQFRAEIDGLNIHFIHERGKGPHPLPIILTHGWPDSFYRMHKIIPLLTDPASYGGSPLDAFEVIVPSLPGFGFSDRPSTCSMTPAHVANLWAYLMHDLLGFQRFAAAGGDWGGTVTRFLAQMHPGLLIGMHLTDIGFFFRSTGLLDLTPTEQQFLDILEQWSAHEAAFAQLQGTKPQTLAYGLNDSPVGLAGWLTELFRALSDCNGDVEKRFTKDELLTNIMIYWVTETIGSSTRIYYESRHSTVQQQRSDVPAGLAIFPKDIAIPPRSWAERTLRVEHWAQMPRGGHFAALEEPELLAEDIRAFFRPFRGAQRQRQS